MTSMVHFYPPSNAIFTLLVSVIAVHFSCTIGFVWKRSRSVTRSGCSPFLQRCGLKFKVSALHQGHNGLGTYFKIGAEDWVSQHRELQIQSCSRVVIKALNGDNAGSFLWGGATLAGSDPDRAGKTNQDTYFAFTFLPHVGEVGEKYEERKGDKSIGSGEGLMMMTCVGVMDGHGFNGHIVTSYLKDRLPVQIQSEINAGMSSADGISPATSTVIETALARAFQLAHDDALQDSSIPAGRSGTTCVTCLVEEGENKLYVANVGDSTAVMARRRRKMVDGTFDEVEHLRTKSDGVGSDKWSVTPLSRKTTTQIPEERSRIEAAEGRIDSSGNVFYGPIGIAMTRALGDAVMARAGVVPRPEVLVFDLNVKTDEKMQWFAVLGTDGLFDVLTNAEVVDIVGSVLERYPSDMRTGTTEAAECVVRAAREEWLGGLPLEVRVDDITCVILCRQNQEVRTPR